jgi:hypothetical protein
MSSTLYISPSSIPQIYKGPFVLGGRFTQGVFIKGRGMFATNMIAIEKKNLYLLANFINTETGEIKEELLKSEAVLCMHNVGIKALRIIENGACGEPIPVFCVVPSSTISINKCKTFLECCKYSFKPGVVSPMEVSRFKDYTIHLAESFSIQSYAADQETILLASSGLSNPSTLISEPSENTVIIKDSQLYWSEVNSMEGKVFVMSKNKQLLENFRADALEKLRMASGLHLNLAIWNFYKVEIAKDEFFIELIETKTLLFSMFKFSNSPLCMSPKDLRHGAVLRSIFPQASETLKQSKTETSISMTAIQPLLYQGKPQSDKTKAINSSREAEFNSARTSDSMPKILNLGRPCASPVFLNSDFRDLKSEMELVRLRQRKEAEEYFDL